MERGVFLRVKSISFEKRYIARLLVIKRNTTFVFKRFSHNPKVYVKDLNNQHFGFLLLSVLSFPFFLKNWVKIYFFMPHIIFLIWNIYFFHIILTSLTLFLIVQYSVLKVEFSPLRIFGSFLHLLLKNLIWENETQKSISEMREILFIANIKFCIKW